MLMLVCCVHGLSFVVQASSLDNIYNGHLVGPEQLRDLSSKGLLSASSFKNGHFLTKAGVRSRGGEHFHEVIQGVLPTAMGPTVFGRMHPSAVFESIACILELVLLPAWRVRVELDPCLDSITPDAAPYLVGPHASEVGEAVCCDELGRIGKSIAKAQGLVAASVRVKAGVAGTYWSTPEVEKRKLSELKIETLTAAGELKLVAHYERCSPYSGITAAELCKRELTSAARELRASAHRKALAGSVAIAEELKAEALAQEPSAHTQP